jgi:predicted PhzF superfamily epimerase YddE/YHI9
MPELHVLRVFTADDGSGGNPLGVFLRGAEIPAAERQSTAAELGFSETAFVDDPAAGSVQIFTPAVEMPFAGHPLVGTAWLLAAEGQAVATLRPPAGPVPVHTEGRRAFVAGRPEWAPSFDWRELASPAEVESLTGSPGGHDSLGVYAWADEHSVRARVFAARYGIAEDEATGAAAVRLGALLGRPVTIRQGRGSVIEVTPRDDGMVEIGGRVALDEVRPYPPSGGVARPPNSST